MTLHEMDALIRTAVPDEAQRRTLLTGLGDLAEAFNHHLGYLLDIQGYTYNPDDDTWSQTTKPTRREVNS